MGGLKSDKTTLDAFLETLKEFRSFNQSVAIFCPRLEVVQCSWCPARFTCVSCLDSVRSMWCSNTIKADLSSSRAGWRY